MIKHVLGLTAPRLLLRLLRVVLIVYLAGTTVQVVAHWATPNAMAIPNPINPCHLPGDPPGVNHCPGGGGVIPQIKDCAPAPDAQATMDTGLPGFLDSGPPNPNRKLSLLNQGATPDIYATIGYPSAPVSYNNGCFANTFGSGAGVETEIGNWLRSTATALIALTVALGRTISPPTFMQSFDPLLTAVTAQVRDAIFKPYVGIPMALLGLWLIVQARKKRMHNAVEMSALAMLALTIAVAAWSYPKMIGHSIDSGATSVMDTISTSFGEHPANKADPAGARAEIMVNAALYRTWLMAEVGSADSVTAHKYGLKLLDSQTISYGDELKIQHDPAFATKLLAQKQAEFTDTANKVKSSDPTAYSALKGGFGRISAGGISLLMAVAMVPFILASYLLIVYGFLMVRFALMVAPAIAPVAILRFDYMLGMLNRVGGAFGAALWFAVGAVINIAWLRVLFTTDIGQPMWFRMLLAAAGWLLLWNLFKPASMLPAKVRKYGRRYGRKISGRAGKIRRSVAGSSWLDDAARTSSTGSSADDDDTDDDMVAAPEPSYEPDDPEPPGDPGIGIGVIRYSQPGTPPAIYGDTTYHRGDLQEDPDMKVMQQDVNGTYVTARTVPDEWVPEPTIIDDGSAGWRIWNPDTGDYETVDKPGIADVA